MRRRGIWFWFARQSSRGAESKRNVAVAWRHGCGVFILFVAANGGAKYQSRRRRQAAKM
jgi:hypothetical protein